MKKRLLLLSCILFALVQCTSYISARRIERNEGYQDPLYSILEYKYSKSRHATEDALNDKGRKLSVLTAEDFRAYVIGPQDLDLLIIVGGRYLILALEFLPTGK